MRTGITLLEVLLSLVLIASITAATLSWSRHSIAVARAYESRSRWLMSAEALLDAVHADCILGDAPPSIVAAESSLTIAVRPTSAGLAIPYTRFTRSYHLSGDHIVILNHPTSGDELLISETALDRVSRFDVRHDAHRHVLEISVYSTHGLHHHRIILLPENPGP